jgi:tetratricopeptide (TPR) repeat protein
MPDKDKEMALAALQTRITTSYQQGDFTSALDLSKDLLKQTEDHFSHMHPATASAYNNVGLMHKLLGDFIEARSNYNHAMRIYGQVVGRDHASYAMILHNLGTLNRTQIHLDSSLKATERLSLVETALEYLEEALEIRKAELGDEHPHTVATQSSIGSTLAAQVLYQHKVVEAGKDSKSTQQRQYVSLNADAVTEQGWNAAEVYLRQALETSITSPRGRTVSQNNNNGQNSKSKKQKDKPTKTKKGHKKGDTEDIDNGPHTMIQTLSAAAAAQNLAVFLKSRGVTQQPYHTGQLYEAQQLYNQVIQVRSQLLPVNHPDLYATQYSLAELLEMMGDEEAANALRQAILDTYDPPPPSAPESASSPSLTEELPPQQQPLAVEHASSKQDSRKN